MSFPEDLVRNRATSRCWLPPFLPLSWTGGHSEDGVSADGTEHSTLTRGVKRYFREPWLGFYFYCEPWIVSYFLREPWMDLPLFSLWFVNWVLFSREPWIGILYFPCDSWLTSFLFPWTVNFAYYLREFSNFPPKIHMSFIVMIRNWFLMIDIGALFSEMWRRLATISYLKLNYESWHNACTSDFKRDYTRVSKGGLRGGGQEVGPPPFFSTWSPPPFFGNFNAHTILILSNDLLFAML